jgi:OmpA-OmpF porin, OOP family
LWRDAATPGAESGREWLSVLGGRNTETGGGIMGNSRLTVLLWITLCLGVLSEPARAQDEEEAEVKAKDTPYFSAMPGYVIIDTDDKKFADYHFFNSEDCTTVEGKRFFRAYTLKEGAESASDLQISRNYANAVKAMGGTVLFAGLCEGANCAENCGYQMMVGKVTKDGSELWVEVVPFNDGNDYYLTVVAKAAMVQEITAGAMLDALNKDGRIALYINFDTGKSTIRPDSAPIIEQIVQMMKANADLALSVEGHTDSVGEAKSNQTLSESRAKAVVAAIVAQGIAAQRLRAAGYGEDKPIADNASEEGRAKNRRVELVK